MSKKKFKTYYSLSSKFITLDELEKDTPILQHPDTHIHHIIHILGYHIHTQNHLKLTQQVSFNNIKQQLLHSLHTYYPHINIKQNTITDLLFKTKRLKYQSLLKNYKDKLKITEKENKLSSYNFKTYNLDKFKKCIEEKLKVNKEVYQLYQDIKFRQYKLYSYINTKRSEDNMLNKIEKKYSKEHIIIIGDWSIGKQMKNFISTPNIGLKRKLKERFKVYNIDEFRTSCLSHKTEDKCENLYQPDKKNKSRKLHAVLTYQMENKRIGCVNRDKNSCYNMKKIFDSYLLTGDRPEKYCRDYNFDKIS